MEIKNILSKINQTPEEPQNFFAVEIGYEVVKTAIWHVKDKITQILSIGSIEEWANNSEESLLEAIDASISVAVEGFEQVDINEVIFGLPETWVGPGGIVDSKKDYLKTVTKKLDLKPVGFVVTTEAIIHHLRIREGGPPSVILISLTESEAIVTMIQVGEIIGTQVVGRSDDLSKDVEEALARFSDVKDFPTRMLLYDGNIDLDSAKQTLISYDWQNSGSFLHFPKIEDMAPQSTIKAIAIAGGTEVAKSLGIQVEEPKEEAESETQEQEPEIETKEEVSAEDFGFTEIQPDQDEVLDSTPTSNQDGSTDELIGDNFESVKEDESIIINQPPEESDDPIPDTAAPESETKPKKKKFSFKFPKLKLPKLRKPGKKLSIPSMIVIGIITMVGIFGAGFFAYWSLPKAEVIIHIKPKTIEKEISFILDTSQDILDADRSIIPASEESIELEGEREAETTGSKLVGERATGTVSIFNLTEYEKTFEAGSTISYEKLRFTINETITIASATAELSSDYKRTVTPSQESVKVTAIDIGDQYNFSTGTELSVESFDKSSFVAKATTDFKGGFAREIQAVSKDDQENLKEALLEELKAQGVSKLGQVSSQKKGIVELKAEEIIKETYSADIGDEEEALRLALKFTQPIYTYQLADLGMLIEKQYQDDLPENFKLDSDNLNISIIETEVEDDGKILVTAKSKLSLTPNLNPDEIAQNIMGKYPEVTKDYFANLPNFQKVETKFNVSLPSKLQTFPRKKDNITVTVKIVN